MPQVVAKQFFEYAGRSYAPGEILEVDEKFVRILLHVGRIEPPADSSGNPYRTTSIQSAPTLKDAAAPQKRRRNRESLLGTVRR
jgi:hypothetical protein